MTYSDIFAALARERGLLPSWRRRRPPAGRSKGEPDDHHTDGPGRCGVPGTGRCSAR
jgi:hypothetical protein